MTPGGLGEHLQSLKLLPPDYFWHRHRYRLALEFVPPHARTLLDYGCGDGRFVRTLVQAFKGSGRTILACDTFPLAYEALQEEIASQQARWLANPAEVQGSCDFVSALDVIEHCEDDRAEVFALARLLRPGGVLFISVPAFPELWSDWDAGLGHFRRYRPEGLAELLAAAGLRVQKCSCFFSYLAVPAWLRARRRGGERPAQFPILSGPANGLLNALGFLERRWLQTWDIPFGSSVFAAATAPT